MKYAIILLAGLFPSLLCAVEWGVQADFDNQVFPSYLISTATIPPVEEEESEAEEDDSAPTLGDPESMLGIWINEAKKGQNFTVTLKKGELWDESTVTGEVPDDLETVYIAPKINYRFDQLRATEQMSPTTAVFSLNLDGKEVGTQSVTLNVHSINDCPYGVLSSEEELDNEKQEGANDSYVDLGWMFSAYVNESHPMLDKVLKEALETGIVNSFTGYQTGNNGVVLAQVYAIWDTLYDRGIHYSDISASPDGSKSVFSQHVRFLEQSIDNHQANCVDGSVLLASFMAKIGLKPFLVIVPGHMYVGVYLDKEEKDSIGLETTLIGNEVRKPAEIKALREVLPEDAQQNSSLENFEAAVLMGSANLEKNAQEFEGDDPRYQITDIKTARDEGVMPIPYRREK